MGIIVMKPSLDDVIVDGNPCLRGVIHPDSISALRVDLAYQREFLNVSTRRHIMGGLAAGQRLPDIELGMRGEKWNINENGDADLLDPVFILDGQQRRGSILEYRERFPDADPRLGVIVHFNTKVEWERQRFQDLNLHQTRVGTGIILRNIRTDSIGIATAYGLSQADRTFPLYDKVGWSQSLAIKDILSAGAYLTGILVLHGHVASGVTQTALSHIQIAFDKLVEAISLPTLRNNIKAYWDLIEDCWGVRDLTGRGATWMRHTFQRALQDVLSDHLDFWSPTNNKLIIPNDLASKISKFPVGDPEIRQLASSSGAARHSLTFHLVNYINKGRQKHLTKRSITELNYRATLKGRPRKTPATTRSEYLRPPVHH